METFLIKDILLLERVQCSVTKFILGDYCMDYKSRLTNLKLLPLMYINYELTDILFAIKPFKKCTNSFVISQHLQFNELSQLTNLMNWQLDLPTLSYVTRCTAMPSLLILILVGYPDYGMHYQS